MEAEKMKILGITFYLITDREILFERKPRSNILVDKT
jgi:hypothetical protein